MKKIIREECPPGLIWNSTKEGTLNFGLTKQQKKDTKALSRLYIKLKYRKGMNDEQIKEVMQRKKAEMAK